MSLSKPMARLAAGGTERGCETCGEVCEVVLDVPISARSKIVKLCRACALELWRSLSGFVIVPGKARIEPVPPTKYRSVIVSGEQLQQFARENEAEVGDGVLAVYLNAMSREGALEVVSVSEHFHPAGGISTRIVWKETR